MPGKSWNPAGFDEIIKIKNYIDMMKKVILVIAFMAINTAFLYAQHFTITDKGLVWSNVYVTDMNSQELLKSLHISNIGENIEMVDSTMIVGKMKAIKFDYKSFGLTWGKTAVFFQNHNLGPASFIMQIKDGRYKIIVQSIYLESKVNTSLSPYGSLTSLDSYALYNNEYVEGYQTYGDIYAEILTQTFKLTRTDEEW